MLSLESREFTFISRITKLRFRSLEEQEKQARGSRISRVVEYLWYENDDDDDDDDDDEPRSLSSIISVLFGQLARRRRLVWRGAKAQWVGVSFDRQDFEE